MKNFLKITDFSKQELTELLDSADQLKYEHKHGIEHKVLSGKTLGMIFAKTSTRTRVSFETGIYQLGGHGLFLSSSELQLGLGEPIKDTARALSRYVDAIMIRTFEHSDVEELAMYADIPVINGRSNIAHPCQALGDLMTIREYKTSFRDLKLCFLGNGNTVANSLLVGCMKMGISVSIACPQSHLPSPQTIEYGKESGLLTITTDPYQAICGADIVYTDVWYSMDNQKYASTYAKTFFKYQLNTDLLNHAKKDCTVLHCLPARRGEEITDTVLEMHQKEIFNQTENRLHAQKAVMKALMNK